MSRLVLQLRSAELTLTEPLEIDGSVTVRLSERARCRDLVVEGGVTVTGPRGPRSEVLATTTLPTEGVWEADRDYETPFTLRCHGAPPTLPSVGLTWWVRARARPGRTGTLTDAVVLRVAPPRPPLDFTLDTRVPPSRPGVAPIVVGVGMVVLFGTFTIGLLSEPWSAGSLLGVLFCVAMALGGGLVTRTRLAERRALKRVDPRAHRVELRVEGGSYRAASVPPHLVCEVQVADRTSTLTAALVAERRFVDAGVEAEVPERLKELFRAEATPNTPDARGLVTFTFALPEAPLPPSFRAAGAEVRWSLRLGGHGAAAQLSKERRLLATPR